MKLLLCIAAFLVAKIHFSDGTSLVLNSSSSKVKPSIDKNLTLRCAIVEDLHDNATENETTVYSSKTNKIKRVSSIVIRRNGRVIAHLNYHESATASSGYSGFHVTGDLTPSANQKGYIQLLWPHPSTDDVGQFMCKVHAVSQEGSMTMLEQQLMVRAQHLILEDILPYLNELKAEIKQLKSEKSRVPSIFFYAAKTKGPAEIKGKTVIYNRILINEGEAYSGAKGVFTAPVAGYYRFDVDTFVKGIYSARLQVKKNDVVVNRIYGMVKHGFDISTRSLMVKLEPGDEVKVFSVDTYMPWITHEHLNTFSGRLFALA